jgi:hypothetical protein
MRARAYVRHEGFLEDRSLGAESFGESPALNAGPISIGVKAFLMSLVN